MAFRIAQFNILGRQMAGTMWFHYARDFLPRPLAASCPEWTRAARFPRCLRWQPSDGPSRFYRFPVLLAEIRALRADVICLVELDCFDEFREVLGSEGYDAVFQPRPGKADGCGIFWRRDMFAAAAPYGCLAYSMPCDDRIVVAQSLQHIATSERILVLSTHFHWDQQAGHQVLEAKELLRFVKQEEQRAGIGRGAVVVCGDLNTIPGTTAYQVLRRRFCDAAIPEEAQEYSDGAFTSLKPDTYYFAWPRGARHDPEAVEEWHWQEGRQEVIDYIFYDPDAFEVEARAAVARLQDQPPQKRMSGVLKKPPYGFWAGGWAFAESPAPGWRERLCDPTWRPARAHGQLQLGIPNRLHGSDHLPVACTLRLRGRGEDGS